MKSAWDTQEIERHGVEGTGRQTDRQIHTYTHTSSPVLPSEATQRVTTYTLVSV